MSAAYAPHYPAVTGYAATAATFNDTIGGIEQIAASGSAKNLSDSEFEKLHRKIKDLSYKVVGNREQDERLWNADVKIFNDRFPGKNITCRNWMGDMKPKGMSGVAAPLTKGSMTKTNG